MIQDEARIIYSKRFPKVNLTGFGKEQGAADDGILKPPMPFEEFCKRLVEKSAYFINPYKMIWRQKFIDLAIGLSEEYEIDMDIKEYLYYISVNMYLDSASCAGNLKSMFAALLTMCDRVD